MNIQFCHKRKTILKPKIPGCMPVEFLSARVGMTVAMEEVQAWFFETLEPGTFFEKRVGFARCSDEDNYCKKTGREFALSRLKATRLTVLTVHGKGTKEHVVVLKDKDGGLYHLTKYGDTQRVYFEEYHA